MQHLNPIFLNLALILVVAGATTLIFKYLKQPPVLGYILAGFITGPHFKLFPTVLERDTISVWGEIGVVFLLFALGLEFSLKKIKQVGSTGAVTAVTEALIMMLAGFVIGRFMGWSHLNALFLGGMLSISSTSIIIKAFEDLQLKTKRFSQIVVGVLVFEDLVAIMLLVLLSTIAVSKQFDGTDMLFEMGKLVLFLILCFTAGIFVIPTIFKRLRRFMNDETLLVVSMGLCLGMVVIADKSGFSPALGAFLMGIIIAETTESERVHQLITPVRNLFAAVFFISVGMLVNPAILLQHIVPIAIITLTVLLIKPVSAMLGLLLSGHTVKQSMQSGMCLSQIGEFSFIIATLGLSLKVIDEYLYPVIVTVSIITIFATPYMIRFAEPLYEKFYRNVPQSWRIVIQEYGNGSRTLNHDGDLRGLMKCYASRIMLHSVWSIAVIIISVRFAEPFAHNLVGDEIWVSITLCVLTLSAMAPFLYALMVKPIAAQTYERMWTDRKYVRGPLIALRLARMVVGAGLIGVVIGKFISTKVAFTIPAVVVVVALIFLSRRLKSHYYSIEERFMSNLEKSGKNNNIAIPKHLSNEIHMEYVDIMVYCDMCGKTIRQIHRDHHTGAQIISIYRKGEIIELPPNTEMLHAGDRVLAVGNDQQIQNLRNHSTPSETAQMHTYPQTALNIYQITVPANSPLCAESANVSELINKFGFMLIGYERESQKFRRPKQGDVILADDTLWVVGNKNNLANLI